MSSLPDRRMKSAPQMIANQVYDIIDRHFNEHDFNAAHQEIARQLRSTANNLVKHSANIDSSLQRGPHQPDVRLAGTYASQLRTILHQAANQRLIRYDQRLEEQIASYQSILRGQYSRRGMSLSGPEPDTPRRFDVWQQIKSEITQDFKKQ